MAKRESLWTRSKKNLRSRLISGTVVLVPVFITIAILRWLFEWLSGFLAPAIRGFVEPKDLDRWFGKDMAQDLRDQAYIVVPVMAILLLVVVVYFVGVIARRVVGRRIIGAGERLLLRIPLVKPVYATAKQVVEAISLPDRAAFKAVVLIHFPHPRMWAVGFLTGLIADQHGKKLYKVFIPTTPNPTTGFFEFAEPEELLLTDIAVEEAFKMIVSGGIIAPEAYNARPISELHLPGQPLASSSPA